GRELAQTPLHPSEVQLRKGEAVVDRDRLIEERLRLSVPARPFQGRCARPFALARGHARTLDRGAAVPDRRRLLERAARGEQHLRVARKELQALTCPAFRFGKAGVPLAAVRDRKEEATGEALRVLAPGE